MASDRILWRAAMPPSTPQMEQGDEEEDKEEGRGFNDRLFFMVIPMPISVIQMIVKREENRSNNLLQV